MNQNPTIHRDDVVWCKQASIEEAMRTIGKKLGKTVIIGSTKDFYSYLLSSYNSTHHYFTKKYGLQEEGNPAEVLLDYIWVRQGRWTGLIDKPMIEALAKMNTCTDIRGIFTPCDAMHFVFEKGTEIDGIPLRMIAVCLIRSDIARELMREIMPRNPQTGEILEPPEKNHEIWMFADTGQNMLTDEISHNEPPENCCRWWCSQPLNGEPSTKPNSLTAQEKGFMVKVEKIVKAALMYYTCRPSTMREHNEDRSPYVVPYPLPRSQRYEFKGPRDKIFRYTTPIMPKVNQPPSELILQGTSNRTIAMHFRNASLHMLKHPRWYGGKAPESGKYRTILVKSCWVNAKQGEPNNENDNCS